MINIDASGAFPKYGGGFNNGAHCARIPDHFVALVGHRGEDDQEFWLIRNSYGTDWGERGHHKLPKSATEKCAEEEGFASGTEDGHSYRVAIRKSLGSSHARVGPENGGKPGTSRGGLVWQQPCSSG